MSHLEGLGGAKARCETTKDCSEYQTLLAYEFTKIDSRTTDANLSALFVGGLGVVLGVIIILTASVKPFLKIQKIIIPNLLIILPVVIGLAAGFIGGILISFGACFKQSCSQLESSAGLTLPVLSLFLTIPLARLIARKKQNLANYVGKLKPAAWIISGLLVVAVAISLTVSVINRNNLSKNSQKEYLKNLKY